MTHETITLRDDLRMTLQGTMRDTGSLSDLVNEAVEAYLDARQNEKLDREIAAFTRLLPTLQHTYPGIWVAIHDEQVVDHDPDRRALYRRIRSTYGSTPVLIRHVDHSANDNLWIRTPSTGRHLMS